MRIPKGGRKYKPNPIGDIMSNNYSVSVLMVCLVALFLFCHGVKPVSSRSVNCGSKRWHSSIGCQELSELKVIRKEVHSREKCKFDTILLVIVWFRVQFTKKWRFIKKKSTKIIPIEQEEWFYAISFDKLIYLLIERANHMIPG